MKSELLTAIISLLLSGDAKVDLGSPVHPANGSINVPVDTIVSISSGQSYNVNHVPTQAVVLKSGNATVNAKIIVSDRSISLVPEAFLSANTTYIVEFSAGVSSIIPGFTHSTTSFRTGSQSTVADDLAMFRNFKHKVLEWGPKHDASRRSNVSQLQSAFHEALAGNLYYDATYGYYATAQFLGLTGVQKNVFNDYAQFATNIYRTIIGENMNQPGRRIFPAGLYHDVLNDYEVSGAAHTLSVLTDTGVFSRIDNPSSFIGFNNRYEKEGNLRPLAYYLEALLYYERAGNIVDDADALEKINKINLAKNGVLKQLTAMTSHQFNPQGHANGWTNKFTQTFMTGLGADALIDYLTWLRERRSQMIVTTGLQTYAEAIAEIQPILQKLADWVFEANNYVVRIDTTGLNLDDVITFTSDIDTFSDGSKTRTRVVIDIDLDAAVIKQVMPFADGDEPVITVTGPNGVIAHTIEENVKMWIPEVGGSPGAWNDLGGSGLGGAFRYVVPSTLGPNGTKSVGSTSPSVDLNMLMLPLMGFMYEQTCDVKWKVRGDAVFDGGVLKAFWASTKQYNQQLKNTFSYFAKRQSAC